MQSTLDFDYTTRQQLLHLLLVMTPLQSSEWRPDIFQEHAHKNCFQRKGEGCTLYAETITYLCTVHFPVPIPVFFLSTNRLCVEDWKQFLLLFEDSQYFW